MTKDPKGSTTLDLQGKDPVAYLMDTYGTKMIEGTFTKQDAIQLAQETGSNKPFTSEAKSKFIEIMDSTLQVNPQLRENVLTRAFEGEIEGGALRGPSVTRGWIQKAITEEKKVDSFINNRAGADLKQLNTLITMGDDLRKLKNELDVEPKAGSTQSPLTPEQKQEKIKNINAKAAELGAEMEKTVGPTSPDMPPLFVRLYKGLDKDSKKALEDNIIIKGQAAKAFYHDPDSQKDDTKEQRKIAKTYNLFFEYAAADKIADISLKKPPAECMQFSKFNSIVMAYADHKTLSPKEIETYKEAKPVDPVSLTEENKQQLKTALEQAKKAAEPAQPTPTVQTKETESPEKPAPAHSGGFLSTIKNVGKDLIGLDQKVVVPKEAGSGKEAVADKDPFGLKAIGSGIWSAVKAVGSAIGSGLNAVGEFFKGVAGKAYAMVNDKDREKFVADNMVEIHLPKKGRSTKTPTPHPQQETSTPDLDKTVAVKAEVQPDREYPHDPSKIAPSQPEPVAAPAAPEVKAPAAEALSQKEDFDDKVEALTKTIVRNTVDHILKNGGTLSEIHLKDVVPKTSLGRGNVKKLTGMDKIGDASVEHVLNELQKKAPMSVYIAVTDTVSENLSKVRDTKEASQRWDALQSTLRTKYGTQSLALQEKVEKIENKVQSAEHKGPLPTKCSTSIKGPDASPMNKTSVKEPNKQPLQH